MRTVNDLVAGCQDSHLKQHHRQWSAGDVSVCGNAPWWDHRAHLSKTWRSRDQGSSAGTAVVGKQRSNG
jgi:hypothetical protein